MNSFLEEFVVDEDFAHACLQNITFSYLDQYFTYTLKHRDEIFCSSTANQQHKF